MSTASVEPGKKHSGHAATHQKVPQQSADSGKEPGNGMDREEMIAVAAYYLAEHRGFDGGDPVADWLTAEAEIDAALNSPHEVVVH